MIVETIAMFAENVGAESRDNMRRKEESKMTKDMK